MGKAITKRFFQLNLCVLAVLVISGCANRTPPITSGIGASEIRQGDDFNKHLKIDNPELANKLVISDIKSRKSNDLLEVNLSLKSGYEKSQKLQYHFNWFDAQGFVIESRKTAWKPLSLHGHQPTTVRGLAPSTSVESFNIYVREVPEKAYKY